MYVDTTWLYVGIGVVVVGFFLLLRIMNAIHLDVCQIRAWIGEEMAERNEEIMERKRRAEETAHEAKIQALMQRYNVPEEWLRDSESILFDVLSDPNMSEEAKQNTITFEGIHLLKKKREAGQLQSSEPSPPG